MLTSKADIAGPQTASEADLQGESKIDLSVIVAIRDEGVPDDIAALYREYSRQIKATGLEYEFVFVAEGDNPTLTEQLGLLARSGEPVRLYKLARSYGDATILSVGFDNARGPLILTLPAYHQVEPTEIGKLLDSIGNNDVVVVRRWPRRDGALSLLQTKFFHYVLRRSVGVDYHDLGCAVRLVRKRVTQDVPVYGYKHWFLPVLAHRHGFRVVEVEAEQAQPDADRRRYSFGVYARRLLDLLSIFFLVKFTKKPLRFFGISGLVVFAAGTLFMGYLAYERMFEGVALADRPTLLLAVLMVVLGVQLFAIGLIGELIIFTHARDLREYAVEEIIN
ncbi:MAG: glycosyltransferase [Rhodothermales bacterium]|nr:glycosyltransferase [Rhodothermales bacterium]